MIEVGLVGIVDQAGGLLDAAFVGAMEGDHARGLARVLQRDAEVRASTFRTFDLIANQAAVVNVVDHNRFVDFQVERRFDWLVLVANQVEKFAPQFFVSNRPLDGGRNPGEQVATPTRSKALVGG